MNIEQIVFEIIVIFSLIIANGIFAMSEMALVSAKKAVLQKKAEEGSKASKIALELANAPNRFLSTVQFGITLIGIGAGAFGGATLAEELTRVFSPLFGTSAEPVSIAIVVIVITLASIILGELAPKKLALNFPEQIAVFVAHPMDKLSRLASPLVHILGWASDGVLRLFGVSGIKNTTVSEEELKFVIEQGLRTGVFEQAEKEMLEGVLTLDDLTVEDIMTPRTRIISLNVDDPDELNWRKIVASGHSNFPVYQGQRDQILGIVSIKALWANLSLVNKVDLRALTSKPYFVPASMSVMKLLDTLKQSGRHIALVADEFGGIEGLVSISDVLEAIVGELPTRERPKKYQARQRPDGSWVVDGMLDIDEFKETFGIKELPSEESDEYKTLGGFMVSQLERIPEEGDHFTFDGYRFEVLDMDHHRIDKVSVTEVVKRESQETESTDS